MNYRVDVVEDGYGDTKCVTADKSFIVESNVADWQPNLKGDFDTNKNVSPLDYIAVTLEDGSKYIVGKSAMQQDSNSVWFGGENKHEDDLGFPALLKSCLGLICQDDDESETTIIDALVMGLPVKSYRDQNRHVLLRKKVLGDHRVELELADGSKFERSIYIKDLLIKQQPFGGLADIMLNDAGEVVNKDVAQGFNVVVDIGSRTLNIYTLDNLNPINELTTHTNDGMYTAYMMVNGYIENKLGYSVPTGKLPLVIKSGTVKGMDLTPVIEASYKKLSYKIKGIIDTKFIDSWALVDKIIFTGGGSELLKHWLEELFSNKEVVFLDRYANARGLRKWGIRQMNKSKKRKKSDISIKVGDKDVESQE